MTLLSIILAGLKSGRVRPGLIFTGGGGGVADPQESDAFPAKVGSVSVCGVWSCVDVVAGIV